MEQISTSKQSWILIGYEMFSLEGPTGLKIEVIARQVKKSKSSFYHHFADLEIFQEYLLKHHLKQAYFIGEKEKNSKNIDPDIIDILIEHKTDLLFNRQLRIHSENKGFYDLFLKSNHIIANSFLPVWEQDLDLKLNQSQLNGFFELGLENFFLQINAENLNHEWLANYFSNLKRIVCNLS